MPCPGFFDLLVMFFGHLLLALPLSFLPLSPMDGSFSIECHFSAGSHPGVVTCILTNALHTFIDMLERKDNPRAFAAIKGKEGDITLLAGVKGYTFNVPC